MSCTFPYRQAIVYKIRVAATVLASVSARRPPHPHLTLHRRRHPVVAPRTHKGSRQRATLQCQSYPGLPTHESYPQGVDCCGLRLQCQSYPGLPTRWGYPLGVYCCGLFPQHLAKRLQSRATLACPPLRATLRVSAVVVPAVLRDTACRILFKEKLKLCSLSCIHPAPSSPLSLYPCSPLQPPRR